MRPTATAGNRLPAVRADRLDTATAVSPIRHARPSDVRDPATAAVQTFPGTAHACRGRHSRATYGRAHTQSPGPVSAARNIRYTCMSVYTCVRVYVFYTRARSIFKSPAVFTRPPLPPVLAHNRRMPAARVCRTTTTTTTIVSRCIIIIAVRSYCTWWRPVRFPDGQKTLIDESRFGVKITVHWRIRSGSVSSPGRLPSGA